IFVVVPDLLDHLRATFAPGSSVGFDRRFEEIRRAPLLILDDLGTHSATPWAQEKLFQLFDYRYNARLPTVITMTRDVELDPRLKTRILDISRCQVWEITAPNYRGEARLPGKERGQAPKSAARGRRSLGVSG
ncbi:MAG: ATP-binding protein, partial [Chloroflexi bacterium]|nr:ATP-binding protein [Chloroflexota bacterium]